MLYDKVPAAITVSTAGMHLRERQISSWVHVTDTPISPVAFLCLCNVVDCKGQKLGCMHCGVPQIHGYHICCVEDRDKAGKPDQNSSIEGGAD